MNKQIFNKNILIISSHADDHISCAGTILKLQEERGMVPFELVLTDSSKGQNYKSRVQLSRKKVNAVRLSELTEASRFLGIRKTYLLREPDFGLQYSSQLLMRVAKVIREVKPQTVFINGEFDAHPDHRAAFRIALDSIKLAAMGVDVKNLGEPFRVPTVLCTEQMLPDRIQILVDINNYLDKKEKLLAIYKSQMSPRALSFEKGLMAVRGYHLRKPESMSAEGFSLQQEFPILGFEENETDIF